MASSTLAERNTGVSSGFEKKAGYRVKGKREGDVPPPLPIQAKSFSRWILYTRTVYVCADSIEKGLEGSAEPTLIHGLHGLECKYWFQSGVDDNGGWKRHCSGPSCTVRARAAVKTVITTLQRTILFRLISVRISVSIDEEREREINDWSMKRSLSCGFLERVIIISTYSCSFNDNI